MGDSAIGNVVNATGSSESPTNVASPSPEDLVLSKARRILGIIGMLGETGTKDITSVMEMLINNKEKYQARFTLDQYAESLNSDPKIVKQRIRRAIKKGLTNVASLGVEDYYNDSFAEYANTLFNFEAVRSEMDLIRGKSPYGGSPSIDKFFEGLEMLTNE